MNIKSEREYRLETYIKLIKAYYIKDNAWPDFFEREFQNLFGQPEDKPEPP